MAQFRMLESIFHLDDRISERRFVVPSKPHQLTKFIFTRKFLLRIKWNRKIQRVLQTRWSDLTQTSTIASFKVTVKYRKINARLRKIDTTTTVLPSFTLSRNSIFQTQFFSLHFYYHIKKLTRIEERTRTQKSHNHTITFSASNY